MKTVPLVCLLSSYREGTLIQGAIRSAQETRAPIHVWEGQAGDETTEGPPTDTTGLDGFHWHHGRWHTDAAKRTEMVRAMVKLYGAPLWGLWIDGDEIIVNAQYLPDVIRSVMESEEHDPLDTPRAGIPLHLVERDGRVSIARARCVRIDLIDKYVLSSSGIRFKSGVTQPEGNIPVDGRRWFEDRAEAFRDGAVFLPPPLPCEPFVLHRSWMRHPLRRGLRMHEQEAAELVKLEAAVA